MPENDVPGSAGVKLKRLRELSGWSTSEIADRTGVHLDILTAFEAGESTAASALTQLDLESLASACCGSILDLLGPDHPWNQPEPEPYGKGSGCSIDPWG